MDWNQHNLEEIDLEFNINSKRMKMTGEAVSSKRTTEDEDVLRDDLIINIKNKLKKLREELQKTISSMNLLHNDLSVLITPFN